MLAAVTLVGRLEWVTVQFPIGNRSGWKYLSLRFMRGLWRGRLAVVASALIGAGCSGGRFTSGDPSGTVSETVGGSSARTSSGGTDSFGGTQSGGDGGNGGGDSAAGTTASADRTLPTGGASTLGGDTGVGGSSRSNTGGNVGVGGSSRSNTGGEKSVAGTGPFSGGAATGGNASGGFASPTGGVSATAIAMTGGASSSGGALGSGGAPNTGVQGAVTLTFGERPDASCTYLTTDTDINSAEPDLNYGLAELFGCDASPLRVGLLQFSLDNCTDQIGTLQKVLAARIRLHTGACTGCQASLNTTVQIFELLESWEEGSGPNEGEIGAANWNNRASNYAWAGEGASTPSRGSTALAEFKPTLTNTEYVVALPADVVQRWVTQPSTNFGVALVIHSTAASPSDAVSFGASDGDKSISPLLEIDFAPN